jgi:hypothetical protein
MNSRNGEGASEMDNLCSSLPSQTRFNSRKTDLSSNVALTSSGNKPQIISKKNYYIYIYMLKEAQSLGLNSKLSNFSPIFLKNKQ